MPVFFLYFSESVSLDQAIELGAIYYMAVVLFEVPSGYLSDRAGRKTTLLAAAILAALSYAVFLAASTFIWFALAQVLLAGAIAFQSGSDSSLLFDSLITLNRQQEYEMHEARGQQYAMTALAISVVAGGALGSVNLKLPYLLAFAAAIVSILLCLRLSEPRRSDGSLIQPFAQQIATAIKTMNQPVLVWVLFFYVAGYSLQHIPYEFYQPYIALLNQSGMDHLLSNYDSALVSGIVIGLSMLGGALGATASRSLSKRFGAPNMLIAGIAAQSLIIAILAIVLHPLVLLVIVFRNFSMSMTHAPMHGLIAPRVASAQRATYLSLQSLLGRLMFSCLLFVIADMSGQSLNWLTLSWIFTVSALAGAAVVCLLLLFKR